MRKRLLLLLPGIIILLFPVLPKAQSTFVNTDNCFSVLAGKNATEDGSVLLAHNEDGSGNDFIDWHKVKHQTHEAGEKIIFENGNEIPQVKETNAYFWLEAPGKSFSDSYMNQYGLVIASNQCLSKEDKAEIQNGGIGYWLRRLMAERATSAKAAVKLAGQLIETYGYNSSGRTYCIAGPKEVWMLAVVKGKHWVAQRVPDDQVAVIPNYYTITTINPEDTVNFLGSSDIISYAIKRGWYDPTTGDPFNFRLAYALPSSLYSFRNVARHWQAIQLLSAKQYNFSDPLPFSFIPRKKLKVQELMTLLENHYEGTELEMNPSYNKGNPHDNIVMRICSDRNEYGFTAQVRSDLPPEIGTVMWLAPRHPCIQPYVPWYAGIDDTPAAYTFADADQAIADHFKKRTDLKSLTSLHAFWIFHKLAGITDEDYSERSKPLKAEKNKLQQEFFTKAAEIEKKALKAYKSNPRKAREILTSFTNECALKALDNTTKELSND